MKKSSLFCLVILALVCLTLQNDDPEAIILEPSAQRFKDMLDSRDKSFLILVHRLPCVDKCEAEFNAIKDNLPRFKMIEPNLHFYQMDVTRLPTVQEFLVLDTDHGVYYLFRGERIRVDTNDLSKDQMRHIITDITALVQRRVALVDNWEDIKALNHTYKHLHLFYGPTDNNKNFTEVEIAAKMTERDLFRIQNPHIAKLFHIEHTGLYTYEKNKDDCIRMRSNFTADEVVSFVVTSSRDVPQDFIESKVQSSIHFHIPIMFIYARTETTKKTIQNLLDTSAYLIKPSMHVYELTDETDPSQEPYFNECDLGFNWGFTVCILKPKRGYLYRYVYKHKVLTYDRFYEFLNGFLSNHALPDFRTEHIQQPLTGNVMNLNLESFRELMELTTSEHKQHLLMYYYSDNCNRCDYFQSIFEEFAEKHAHEKLKFGRLNLSKNEALEVIHLKVPSLHYTTGYDDPHVQVYNGEYLSLEDVENWFAHARPTHAKKLAAATQEPVETDL